jgi:hypothetical protein
MYWVGMASLDSADIFGAAGVAAGGGAALAAVDFGAEFVFDPQADMSAATAARQASAAMHFTLVSKPDNAFGEKSRGRRSIGAERRSLTKLDTRDRTARR